MLFGLPRGAIEYQQAIDVNLLQASITSQCHIDEVGRVFRAKLNTSPASPLAVSRALVDYVLMTGNLPNWEGD